MSKLEFRVLVVDDDKRLLTELRARLGGMRESVRGREISPTIDTLAVEVEEVDGNYRFRESTLADLVAISSRRYDYILLDYSYASGSKQTIQWNESGGPRQNGAGNAHLLTVADLADQTRQFASSRGNRAVDGVEGFFTQPTRILLRSFQHDRVNDSLGTFENRLQITQGIFPECHIDALNSFAMIYNSDPDLREIMYHGQSRGREFYRVVALTLQTQMFRAAMLDKLATHAGRLVILRGTWSIALLVTFVSILSVTMQVLIGPLIDALNARNWTSVGVLAFITIAGVLAGASAVAYMLERGLRRTVDIQN